MAIVALASAVVSDDGRATVNRWKTCGLALALGVAAAALGTWPLTRVVLAIAEIARPWFPHILQSLVIAGDPQGVLELAPAAQLGLLAALWFVWRPRAHAGRVVLAVGVLILSFVACLALSGAWLAHAGVPPHALLLRAWSVAMPAALAWVFFRTSGHADRQDDAAYRRFWHDVGDDFPDLSGAASTRMYFENERDLLTEQLAPLAGCRVLKTDLWDEAKNTHILQWAAAHGAQAWGLDVSPPIVSQAKAAFGATPSHFVVADVRQIPFAAGTFDAIYSMGTIEHFAESEEAVVELARLLKPGGRLILGVPNRHDPFLRPWLVALLQRRGWYGYGAEKCYSRRALRHMIERAGLTVVAETGILFIPGWLRMLDLLIYTRWPRLAFVTRPAVAVFAWCGRFPRLRRHGYLLASVGVRS